MIRICPMPDPWNRVYQGLLAAWKSHGEQPPGPPVPLILGGWAFSSDREKERQWAHTISWAKERKLEHLIPAIPDDEWYYGKA